MTESSHDQIERSKSLDRTFINSGIAGGKTSVKIEIQSIDGNRLSDCFQVPWSLQSAHMAAMLPKCFSI
jgi:hypothetical protein